MAQEQQSSSSSLHDQTAMISTAARLFQTSNKRKIDFFEMRDPFNSSNTVSGFINQQEGSNGGSILITHVQSSSNKVVQQQLIHGTPKLHYPYQNYDDYEWKDFTRAATSRHDDSKDPNQKSKKGSSKKKKKNPNSQTTSVAIDDDDDDDSQLDSVVIANKWNGTNILFFVYHDDQGRVCLSAKTKGRAFLQNNRYSPLLDLTLSALGMKHNSNDGDRFIEDGKQYWSKIPFLRYWIERILDGTNEWQSISCELCGQGEPHLVKYDFELALVPLFVQNFNGLITPVQLYAKEMEQEESYNSDAIIEKITDIKVLHEKMKQLQKADLAKNEQYRTENNLKHRYEYNHFITEGRVMYCLNKKGNILNRNSIYKLKPSDVEEVHWATFESHIKERVNEAVRKCVERNRELNLENIRSEMDMREKEWSKFGQKVAYHVEYVLKPEGLTGAPIDKRCVFILCGLPRTHKTQWAQQLEELFNKRKSEEDRSKHLNDPTNHCLEIINQNNPQTNSWKLCVSRVPIVLQRRNSVVFDDCTESQAKRKEVIEAAQSEGISLDQIFVIYFESNQETSEEGKPSSTEATSNTRTGRKRANDRLSINASTFQPPSKEELGPIIQIFPVNRKTGDEIPESLCRKKNEVDDDSLALKKCLQILMDMEQSDDDSSSQRGEKRQRLGEEEAELNAPKRAKTTDSHFTNQE